MLNALTSSSSANHKDFLALLLLHRLRHIGACLRGCWLQKTFVSFRHACHTELEKSKSAVKNDMPDVMLSKAYRTLRQQIIQ